jgi:hypothetical protein
VPREELHRRNNSRRRCKVCQELIDCVAGNVVALSYCDRNDRGGGGYDATCKFNDWVSVAVIGVTFCFFDATAPAEPSSIRHAPSRRHSHVFVRQRSCSLVSACELNRSLEISAVRLSITVLCLAASAGITTDDSQFHIRVSTEDVTSKRYVHLCVSVDPPGFVPPGDQE